jgi:heme-degrading monooxygenase HmoA
MKLRFVLQVRLKAGREGDFLRIYGALRDRVSAGVPGNLAHQACRSQEDPLVWMITSEWENAETYQDWEQSPEHRALTLPLRDCWDEAKRTLYDIRMEANGS